MNAADLELARMVYLASALGGLLVTSLLLRGLWRPLRFLLLAVIFSFFFTPYFVDGRQDYVVPAFVVMANELVAHRHDEHLWPAAKTAAMPIITVAGMTGLLALLLAWLLPKPEARAPQPPRKRRNPYLPEDFQPQD